MSATRIALSGSAGIGKTTLAKALAEHFAIPFISECYEPFFEPPGLSKLPELQKAELFNRVLDGKRLQEERAQSFVVDRLSIDLFHFWLMQNLGRLHDETQAFFCRCADYAQLYDFVIFPSWGSFPVDPIAEPTDLKRRNLNPWSQMRNHATLVGYAQMMVRPVKIIQIPQRIIDPEQRLAFVLRQMKQRAEQQA